jgi:S-adenosylmethionine hydrolase
MIVLFTDFGTRDPYLGQLKVVLSDLAPNVSVVDLFHSVPDFNAHAGAHLLANLITSLPQHAVILGVVDPGVGSIRKAVVVYAEGRWYVGPDNGLFSVLAARASDLRVWQINWPASLPSVSFHGRDLFAPIAAMIANGAFPEDRLIPAESLEVQFDSADLPRIIYIDHYGNAWTGIRAGLVDQDTVLKVKDAELSWRRVFSDADKGETFWYVNSSGLVEIATNRSSAADLLGLKIGDLVRLVKPQSLSVH